METYFHFLQKTYNDIIAGALLSQDSYNCATLLNPSAFSSAKNCELCACHFFRKLDAQISSSLDPINNEHDISKNFSHLKCHAREIILLQLTLIDMMLAKLHLQEAATDIKQKYIEILRILQESNIVSELVSFPKVVFSSNSFVKVSRSYNFLLFPFLLDSSVT